ncbi:MAG: hypothetical protein U0556_07075 [Dehalococcoidia bacterium]
MKRQPIEPTNSADRSLEPTASGSKESLGLDLDSGAETFILRRHQVHTPPADRQGKLEYHTCHEQSFLLRGGCDFDGWYQWRSIGYMMHPPYWWHPSGYRFEGGGMTLVKLDKPVDFILRDVPDGWDGREWIEPSAPHWCRNRTVPNAWLDGAPWEPVYLEGGKSAGFDAKHVWDDVETLWTTWLMRAPAGWRGKPGWRTDGGDELYLLSGDLTVSTDRTITLTEGGYYYDPDRIVAGGEDDSSEGGFVAVRWTKGADHWRLPPIRI